MFGPLLSVALLLASPQAGSSPTTGSINGLVRIAGTGTPIVDARILLAGAGVNETATSDGDGRFSFPSVAAGRYRVTVQSESFVYDVMAAPLIAVAAGRATRMTVDMQRAAAIVGEVRDERGSPRSGVPVTAIRKIAGGTTVAPGHRHTTNDLGEFRVDGLLPGEYVVLASPPDIRSRDEALIPTYYPAAVDREAAVALRLRPGETTSNIFVVMASAPAFSISGVVVDEQGRPLPRILVSFVSRSNQTRAPGQASFQGSMQSFVTAADGTFRITGLRPGTYRVTPTPAPTATSTPWVPPLDGLMVGLAGNDSTLNVEVRDSHVSGLTVVMRKQQ